MEQFKGHLSPPQGSGQGDKGRRKSIGRLLLLSRHCLRLLLLFSPTMSNIVVLFIG